MVLNKEDGKKFDQAARPLMKWLSDNCHPHVCVIVDYAHAELKEGVRNFVTEDYVKD